MIERDILDKFSDQSSGQKGKRVNDYGYTLYHDEKIEKIGNSSNSSNRKSSVAKEEEGSKSII